MLLYFFNISRFVMKSLNGIHAVITLCEKNPSTVIKFVQSSMYVFYFHLIGDDGRKGKIKMKTLYGLWVSAKWLLFKAFFHPLLFHWIFYCKNMQKWRKMIIIWHIRNETNINVKIKMKRNPNSCCLISNLFESIKYVN